MPRSGCPADPARAPEDVYGLLAATATITASGEAPSLATSGDQPDRVFGEEHRFDILLYGGKWADSDMREIIANLDASGYRESFVYVAGLNYKIGDYLGPIDIETEGQIAKHSGLQDHWEVNLLMILRLEYVVANRYSFSTAIGDGFSLASEVANLEREENLSAPHLLQYLMVEIDFGMKALSWHPRFMMRLHHRSGVFGVFCPDTCGSNLVTYGFKAAF